MPPPTPQVPVLDWADLLPARRGRGASGAPPAVTDAPHRLWTTSGRAAIHQALVQAALPPGAGVLVPTYHCPTMVAPVAALGLRPIFYPLRADGRPATERIDPAPARAMLAAHFFGNPLPMAALRAWCDDARLILIEDCAHCFFGTSDGRSVGHWGDFAIASLTKFFPVAEAGLLVSYRHAVERAVLRKPPARRQLAALLDVVETAVDCGRLRGLGAPVAGLRALKALARRPRNVPTREAAAIAPPPEPWDMARVGIGLPRAASWIVDRADPATIAARRRANFAAWCERLSGIPGVQLLAGIPPADAGPYVCPVWVDAADEVYAALRAAALPVLRWDRTFPGTPEVRDDAAAPWRRHLLQFLCHQSLRTSELDRAEDCVRRAVGAAARRAAG